MGGLCTASEDIQDQARTIQDFHLQFFLNITELLRTQLIIKDHQAVRALNTIAMFVRNKGGIDPQVAKEQLTKAADELELVQGSVEEIKDMVHDVHESERFWR